MVWAGFQKYTWIYISAFTPLRLEPIVALFCGEQKAGKLYMNTHSFSYTIFERW